MTIQCDTITETWKLLVRRRDDRSIECSIIFTDRAEAQRSANEDFDAGVFTVSIYAANAFAQAVVMSEEMVREV